MFLSRGSSGTDTLRGRAEKVAIPGAAAGDEKKTTHTDGESENTDEPDPEGGWMTGWLGGGIAGWLAKVGCCNLLFFRI